jgi:hypothetical protein
MFIMPFAREVRLAQTKPTRAPVLGLVLSTPPLRGSQHSQGRSGPRESVVDAAIHLVLSAFCPAVGSRELVPRCGGNSVL